MIQVSFLGKDAGPAGLNLSGSARAFRVHESTLYILERKVIMILLQILWDDILPLFAFIGAGVFLDSKFKIDISTPDDLGRAALFHFLHDVPVPLRIG